MTGPVARALLAGALSAGLVGTPVGLAVALAPEAAAATVTPLQFEETVQDHVDLREICLEGTGQRTVHRQLRGQLVDRGDEQSVTFHVDVELAVRDGRGIAWQGSGTEHGTFRGQVGDDGNDVPVRATSTFPLVLTSEDGRTVRAHLHSVVLLRPDGSCGAGRTRPAVTVRADGPASRVT